jgi:hypothetical protein
LSCASKTVVPVVSTAPGKVKELPERKYTMGLRRTLQLRGADSAGSFRPGGTADPPEAHVEAILRALARIAFFRFPPILVRDSEGTVRIDLSRLTPENWADMNVEVRIVRRPRDGRIGPAIRLRIRAPDKLRALELLAMHMGMSSARRS